MAVTPFRCASCDKKQVKISRCKGCLVAVYCDTTCQKKHWSEHKKVCKLWAMETKTVNMMLVDVHIIKNKSVHRLLASIVTKRAELFKRRYMAVVLGENGKSFGIQIPPWTAIVPENRGINPSSMWVIIYRSYGDRAPTFVCDWEVPIPIQEDVVNSMDHTKHHALFLPSPGAKWEMWEGTERMLFVLP
jgi:hypothetical protein